MSAITMETILPKKSYPFLNPVGDVDVLAKRYFYAGIQTSRNSNFYLNNHLDEIKYFFLIKNTLFINQLKILIKILLIIKKFNKINSISVLLRFGYNWVKITLNQQFFDLIKTHKKRLKNIKAKFNILIFEKMSVRVYTEGDRMGDNPSQKPDCPLPKLRLADSSVDS